MFFIFVPKHFRLPKLPESGYAQDARDFDSKSKGDIVEIRTLPPGWTMTLQKNKLHHSAWLVYQLIMTN